jgi:hypothetical protein
MEQYIAAISWVQRHVFPKIAFVTASRGVADARRPVLLDATGYIDASMLEAADILAKLITVDGPGSGIEPDWHTHQNGVSSGQSKSIAVGYSLVLAGAVTIDGALTVDGTLALI